MDLCLTHLQSAMKGQFIWKDHETKPLQTYEEYEGSAGLAVLVFIGLSKTLAFAKDEVIDYLGIENDEYEHKLEQFNSYIYEALSIVNSEGFSRNVENETTRQRAVRKVYYKSKLVNNYIHWNYVICERLRLSDLPS
jgi:hypothetical protein